MPNLNTRERIPELMDDPGLDPEEHRRALAGLARLNRFSGSVGALWPSVRTLAAKLNRPLRLLDVATGSGDVPRALLSRAERAKIALEIEACDISATAVTEAARETSAIRFFAHDAVRNPLPSGFDIVTCSLFLHHLSADEAVALLTNMEGAARHLILVNDLSRSRFNYAAVWFACRVLSRSPVVRFDGPASVCSAFTPTEALELAERAGLSGATARTRFPCRFLLAWERR